MKPNSFLDLGSVIEKTASWKREAEVRRIKAFRENVKGIEAASREIAVIEKNANLKDCLGNYCGQI